MSHLFEGSGRPSHLRARQEISLALRRNCSSYCCRLVPLVIVFLVWLPPRSGIFSFSQAMLEETELITQQQPYARRHTHHLHASRLKEMSYVYYMDTCPRSYDLVREHMQAYVSQDPSYAAATLHALFYDCFIQGCDASVLLGGLEMTSKLAELHSLRQTSLHIIDDIKASLEVVCPGVVSCSDILALAARDAIFMVGGPWIPILTGRRDQIVRASYKTVAESIPLPTSGFQKLKDLFASKGLNVKDLVALSGAHTIGQTRCESAISQLEPTVSRYLKPSFATNLSLVCLAHDSAVPKPHLTVHLDGLTPNTFDNSFFKNLLSNEAIFLSDAALMDDDEALSYVRSFALDQDHFFEQFRLSFVKMSQIGLLTNAEGEIRMNCTFHN